MEKLNEFCESTDEAMDKKEELESKAETLDEHIQKVIEERDHFIMEKLNALQGDASQKVKANLDSQAQKKLDILNDTQKEITETEEMLTSKLQILDMQIQERKDAFSQIEQLGNSTDIDVADSLSSVNLEIEEMSDRRDRIIQKLRVKAHASGKPIIV